MMKNIEFSIGISEDSVIITKTGKKTKLSRHITLALHLLMKHGPNLPQ
jgi:hypothetical protein